MIREQFETSTPLYHRRHYDSRCSCSTRSGAVNDGPNPAQWSGASWNRGALRMFFSSNLIDYAWPAVAPQSDNGNLYRQDHFVPTALDGDGNVTGWAMSADYYCYDSLNRVAKTAEETYTSAGGYTPSVFNQQFIYDRFGNRLVSSAIKAGVPNPGFKINGTNNRLIAPTNADGVQASDEMRYDASGNLIKDTHTQTGTADNRTYDAENRMLTADGANGLANSYTYDADGQRTRHSLNNGGEVWWQVYGLGGELVAEYQLIGGTPALKKEYGYRNGQLLVMWDGSETGDRQLQWLVQDHLGSTRMVVDRSGSLGGIRRHDFAPFGEELSAGVGIRSAALGYGDDSVRQKFTGKERDNEISLDYFLARYYSSTQGRFTSPDIPFADQSEGDPQSWNLYVYVGNKPLKYTDPFGMWKKVDCSLGDCWEAEEGDTLKKLAKQSGVRYDALLWAFGSFEIKPGESVINVTGVEADHRAYLIDGLNQMPLFEPAIGGGIIKRFGPAAANAAGSFLSRAWAGVRSYFRKPSFKGIGAEEITAINSQVGGTTTLTGYVDTVIANMSYRTSFWDKAATVIRDIAGRHLFDDGNKRTAQMVVEELMRRNGVNGPTIQHIRAVIDKVARGELRSIEEISSALGGAK